MTHQCHPSLSAPVIEISDRDITLSDTEHGTHIASWEESDGFTVRCHFHHTPFEPASADYPGTAEDVHVYFIRLEGVEDEDYGDLVGKQMVRVQYIEAAILAEIQRQRRQSKNEANAA
ncbi:MAG: hypothetical protein Q2484_17105 [Candidatus Sedimenticola sp. (ex Thyasira tokunagai)]